MKKVLLTAFVISTFTPDCHALIHADDLATPEMRAIADQNRQARVRKIEAFTERFKYVNGVFACFGYIQRTPDYNDGEIIKAQLMHGNSLNLTVDPEYKTRLRIDHAQTEGEQQATEVRKLFFRDFGREIITSLSNLDFITDLTLNGLDLSQVTEDDLKTLFTSLKKLKRLCIYSCKLSVLPDNIETLKRLTKLDLSCNELKIIPQDINKLVHLKYITLNANALTEIPDLGGLNELMHLSISHNQLTSLPASILNLPKLEILLTEGNPLAETTGDPTKIGATVIKAFLENKEKVKNIYRNHDRRGDFWMDADDDWSL